MSYYVMVSGFVLMLVVYLVLCMVCFLSLCVCSCIVSLCSGYDGSCVFCLICETCSLRCP